jgi:hypothetical protein
VVTVRLVTVSVVPSSLSLNPVSHFCYLMLHSFSRLMLPLDGLVGLFINHSSAWSCRPKGLPNLLGLCSERLPPRPYYSTMPFQNFAADSEQKCQAFPAVFFHPSDFGSHFIIIIIIIIIYNIWRFTVTLYVSFSEPGLTLSLNTKNRFSRGPHLPHHD